MIRDVVRAREPRGPETHAARVADRDELSGHLEDAAHVPGGHAAALAAPRSEYEVAEILRSCEAVLVVGAQSSLTGGATPRGETLVTTRHFAEITDLEAGVVRAGAGVTLAALDAHLARRGALYPPAPTYMGATVGGTIATNAAGAATFKYGTTRHWVERITVVLATGDVLDVRRGTALADAAGGFALMLKDGRTVRVPAPTYRVPQVPKVSAGYAAAPGLDLIDLFIGSEGTLGVIVDADLRVLPRRPALCLAFLTLRDEHRALALVSRLREASQQTWRSGQPTLDVSAIEHMDARSLALLREDGVPARLGVDLDPAARMTLLVTLDLPFHTTADDVYAALGDAGGTGAVPEFAALLSEFDALEYAILAPPGDTQGAAKLLALREAVPVAVNQRVGLAQRTVDGRIEKTAGDVVVPFEHFGRMQELYAEEFSRRGLDAAVWGHISDGNVHPNVIPRSFDDVVAGREAMLAFGREAIRLGGSPLAEHGVGRNPTKQRLLLELYGKHGIDEMRAVKQALDPAWTLAPGVLFPRGDTL